MEEEIINDDFYGHSTDYTDDLTNFEHEKLFGYFMCDISELITEYQEMDLMFYKIEFFTILFAIINGNSNGVMHGTCYDSIINDFVLDYQCIIKTYKQLFTEKQLSKLNYNNIYNVIFCLTNNKSRKTRTA